MLWAVATAVGIVFHQEERLGKMEILETEFGIAMTQKLREGMEEMNYSDYVENEGIKKGMERGIGKEIFGVMKKLIKNTSMTLEQIMKALEIPDDEQEMYARKALSGE